MVGTRAMRPRVARVFPRALNIVECYGEVGDSPLYPMTLVNSKVVWPESQKKRPYRTRSGRFFVAGRAGDSGYHEHRPAHHHSATVTKLCGDGNDLK